MSLVGSFDAKIPDGPIEQKWDQHKFDVKLVNPANKRKYEIIVVGSGLAGASAAATSSRRSPATVPVTPIGDRQPPPVGQHDRRPGLQALRGARLALERVHGVAGHEDHADLAVFGGDEGLVHCAMIAMIED